VLAYRPKRTPVERDTVSARWARFVTTHRLPVLLVGLGLLGAIALPALHLNLGLPDDGSWPTSTTERRAYNLLAKGFGAGFNGPLTIVVDAPNSSVQRQKEIASAVSHGLDEIPGVAAVSPPMHNQAGDVTVISVTPTGSPASGATNDLVAVIRKKAAQIPVDEDIHSYVTGTTALNIDTSASLSAALPTYIAVVVGLALLLLTVVFRSIWVPIKAAAGFLLSIASSMGVVVWIFQDGHLAHLFNVAQTGPIVSFLPVLLIAILFGLAMDYEVFLVSRMRESFVHTGKPRESIVTGFGQSGRVVTAAALIVIGVFAAFVLDTDPVVKSIALSLACGVLLDAFVVRMTLVPAVMAMLGKKAWWLPHRVERRLPDVDIEGARLLTHVREPVRA
jgi:RND superfamily putative drug exporter